MSPIWSDDSAHRSEGIQRLLQLGIQFDRRVQEQVPIIEADDGHARPELRPHYGKLEGSFHNPQSRRQASRSSVLHHKYGSLSNSAAARMLCALTRIGMQLDGSSHIHLERGDERLLRNLDLAELAHALLALLLLLEELALARHVAAVAFGGDVLA